MSGKEQFSDNFKRDEQEDMLDYDDSAFFYFSLALLTFVLMPYWYFTLKSVMASRIDPDANGVNCESKWF